MECVPIPCQLGLIGSQKSLTVTSVYLGHPQLNALSKCMRMPITKAALYFFLFSHWSFPNPACWRAWHIDHSELSSIQIGFLAAGQRWSSQATSVGITVLCCWTRLMLPENILRLFFLQAAWLQPMLGSLPTSPAEAVQLFVG